MNNLNNEEETKITVLISEIQSIRHELVMESKTIHNFIFAFITSIGLIIGLIVNLSSNKVDWYEYKLGVLAFLVSQIEIAVIFYSTLIYSSISSKMAYIERLETKVNSLLNENLICWASKVTPFQVMYGGTFFYTSRTLFVGYLAIFILLMIFCYDKAEYHMYLWIQIFEAIIAGFLTYKISQENKRGIKFNKKLDAESK